MTQKKPDYRQLSAELNEIVQLLQQETLDVDAAMTKYERGLELVKQLETILKTAENKITKLQNKSETDT